MAGRTGLWAGLALGLAAVPVLASAQLESGTFWSGSWRFDAYGRHAAGQLCWVASPPSRRLEIRQAPRSGWPISTPDPAVLLQQTGSGWTVVLGPGGIGTVNRWQQEWSTLDSTLTPLAGAVLEGIETVSQRRSPQQWSAGDSGSGLRVLGRPPCLGATGGAESGWRTWTRPLAGSAATIPGLNDRRGWGQGAAGEILTLRHRDDLAACQVQSSRRPGRLELRLEGPELWPGAVPPEVFTPLWPLADFFEPHGTGNGTSRP